MAQSCKHFYEFGPYRLDPHRTQLLRDNEPIPLTLKAFETLLILVEHSQREISKDELMKQVWPDTFVEEANLAKHISMVRKALGETAQDRHYIVTLPGRGYRFAEEVRVVPQDSPESMMETHSWSTVVIEEEECPPQVRSRVSLSLHLPQPTSSRLLLAGALLAIVGVGLILHFRLRTRLTGHDSMMLADFINSTGDPAFDGSLKQALAVQLGTVKK
jgi:DNA-binding winged helix-turn-helix (wHTH) protein